MSRSYAEKLIRSYALVIFGKGSDPHSRQVKQILDRYFVARECYAWIELEKRQDCQHIEHYFRMRYSSDRREAPYIFFAGSYFGGVNDWCQAHSDGRLYEMLFALVQPIASAEPSDK